MLGTTTKLTRMELLRAKKKLKLARRGHKLLKDKRDELMKNFLTLIKETKQRREEFEKELEEAYKYFLFVRALTSHNELEASFLYPKTKALVSYKTKALVGVEVPILKLNRIVPDLGYSLAQTPTELDLATQYLSKAIQKLVLVAELVSTSEMLAREIERTRRRVNALEHILIPQLEHKVRYIELKLEEIERANFCNLMRIKEVVRAR
jgi:V/A-type H+-transporting ATPase subunit D